ncbi:MAG: S8 family serine peptidase [Tannerella sp.]|jgi:subtilisin family serine protease|nr:S8 family serine peptidase [Tannerella sp.]
MKSELRRRHAGLFLILCLLSAAGVVSASETYFFRLYLKDKGMNDFTLHEPERFLSLESVERRMLHEVFVDETDFPVSPVYLEELRAAGAIPRLTSKWMKTVVVECADSSDVERLMNMPFVDSLRCVWRCEDRIKPAKPLANDLSDIIIISDMFTDDTTGFPSADIPVEDIYGSARKQIEMLNGVRLHEAGYRGQGMRIAVIDAGFENADRIDAFSSLKLIGTKNITFPGHDVFREDHHGTKALSCLAADLTGVMRGAAPEASYLLIKSEDTRGEFPVEEDYWAAAVEYADSVGIDVISSSLGYFRFDSLPDYYTTDDTDGQTAFVSRIASVAASKGMLVVVSAGNEGVGAWSKITFPADARDILTVGSVTSDGEKSAFSSIGMTADYRIKPDVVALGTSVCVINSSGQTQFSNGTSFSAPTVAGMAACLWQAFPLLRNTELIELIKSSSSQHQTPDVQLGYGIPDIFKAYRTAGE